MAQRDLTLNIGARTKDLNTALGKMRKDVRAATGNVTAMMKQTGMQMTAALTAPLALFGANSLKTFASFEQQMAKVKAVSGATGVEFESLNQLAKDLGATTRFTSSEVAGLMLEFSKLGFTSQEIEKVTASTLALAQATDSDLSQAAAVAGATLRGFGLDASETQRMVDVMAASFSQSALDMNAFQDSMSYVAPVAKAAGVSLEETTAMLGTLHNAGIRGSKAGTALRRIFSEMADSGLPAAESIAKLSKEGIGLENAMDEVGKTAMSALLVLTENKQATDQLTESLKESEGAASSMASIMDNTTEGSFKRMSSAMEAVAISFGESFAPIARGIADVVAGLASVFSRLPGPIRNVLGVLGLLVAAGGPLLLMGPQILAARQALAVFKAELIATRMAAMVLNPMFPLLLASAVALAGGYAILNAKANRATRVHNRLTKQLNKTRSAYKGLSSEMKGKAATESTENLKKRLAELDQQLEENNTTVKAASQGADLYARLNGDAADQINMVRGEIQRNTGASLENKQAVAQNAKIEQERQIILAELQDRLDAAADSTEDYTEETDKLTAAQQRLQDAMKTGEKLGLDPDKLNVGGLLGKLGEGADDGTGVKPFAAMFTLSDEEIAEADKRVDEVTASAQQRLEQFRSAVQSFGQNLAGSIQGIFTQLSEGSKSFGQIMGDILKQLLLKLASMVAAFAILSLMFPGSTGGFGAFMKAGFGFPAPVPMAEGGIVSGPTSIVAGEYAGARSNPEVIAPLSKLQSMMGGGTLSARVSGRDLLFIGSRDSRNARRQYSSTLI